MKKINTLMTLIIFILAILVASCNTTPPASNSIAIPPASTSNIISTTSPPIGAPTPVIEVKISFPNGAPPLNQTKELVCTIINNTQTSDIYVNLNVNLPESLELVSGQPSWEGTTQAKSLVDAIKINVKAIRTGNWAIKAPVNITKIKGYGGTQEIYISISDNSAQWREYPPYSDSSSSPTGFRVVIPTENVRTLPPPPTATIK
jgi:hypothetical protein